MALSFQLYPGSPVKKIPQDNEPDDKQKKAALGRRVSQKNTDVTQEQDIVDKRKKAGY